MNLYHIPRIALPAVLVLAALAAANHAAATPFAATNLTPSSQTVATGSTSSVDLVFSVGSTTAYGLDAWVRFDPTILQITSIAKGASSPFTSVNVSTYNNVTGTFEFAASGNPSGGTFTAATIYFQTIGPATSYLTFSNVVEYMSGYGPYGVNGLATGASVTAVGAAAASSVPDSGATAALLGSAFIGLAALRRKFARA